MDLEIGLAKYNLGELSMSEFPDIALKLVESGIESDSLLMLASMPRNSSSWELQPYVEAAIDEMNLKTYSSLEAAYVVANYYVELFKKGELSIFAVIYKIKNECWDNCHDVIINSKYQLDGVGFEAIIASWYEYMDADESTEWIQTSEKSLSEIQSELEKELEVLVLEWQETFLAPLLNS